MTNEQLSEKLIEIAKMSEFLDENPFKIKAYLKAADIISNINQEFYEFDSKTKIDGIGPKIKEILDEFINLGYSNVYNTLKQQVPKDFFDFLSIFGIGIKKLKILYNELNINTLDDLLLKAKNNEISKIKGFSKKFENEIICEIERIKTEKKFKPYFIAFQKCNEIIKRLSQIPTITNIILIDELKRVLPIVKKYSFLIFLNSEFSNFEKISETICNSLNLSNIKSYFKFPIGYIQIENFDTKTPIEFFLVNDQYNNKNIDQIFSFNLEFLIKQAIKLNLINNLNISEILNLNIDNYVNLYSILINNLDTLDFLNIAPQFSELIWKYKSLDELKNLNLITPSDIKGVFHVHSTYSDGLDKLEEIVINAIKLGYSYIGISDHSKSSYIANGMSIDTLKHQWQEIDKLNLKYKPFKILKGIECDILKDGTLDYSDEILSQFDFVIASIHSNFQMSEDEMTNRIIKAISNPYVTMLGHPTGRIFNKRKGYSINIEKIIEVASKNNIIIELNSNPYRMDIDYKYFLNLNQFNVMISVNPDLHSLNDLQFAIFLGTNALNLGGMPKHMVFNIKSIDEIIDFINNKKSKILKRTY